METSKKELIIFSSLLLLFVSVFSYFAVGSLLSFDGISVTAPSSNTNVSGNIKLNVTVSPNATHNNHVTQVIFMWDNQANPGFFELNTTIFNDTVNDTIFENTSFDTTLLAEGTYNITVNITNATGATWLSNSSSVVSIRIDNTAPTVTINNPVAPSNNFTTSTIQFNVSVVELFIADVTFEYDNASGNAFNITPTNESGNFTAALDSTLFVDGRHTFTIHANDSASNVNNSISGAFMVDTTAPTIVFTSPTDGKNYSQTSNANINGTNSTINFNVTALDALIGMANVTFSFTNASGAGFNVSAVNISGTWTASVNLSQLRSGDHTVYVFANDTLNNANNTEVSLTFTINSPQNVTFVNAPNSNFTIASSTQVFNVSVLGNVTGFNGTNEPISTVIFQFNNASGTDFNVTASNGFAGQYWNVSYNVSTLAEGFHNVTVFVNDSFGNVNKTTVLQFTHDNTGPGITVSCDSPVTSGSTVECTCAADDPISGIAIAAKFNGGGTSESTTASGSSGTSSACTATDHAGNLGTGTGSWIVTSSSGGGGSGGGSGGGVSNSIAGVSVKKVWTSILGGETATVVPKKNGFTVTKVEFDVTQTVYGAWVQVMKVTENDLSDDAQDALTDDQKVYQFIEIKKNEITLKDEFITDPVIEFKIDMDWLDEQNVDQDDVVLTRFVDDEWVELDTTILSEEDDYVEFSAQTPGFSFFAVTVKEGAADSPVDTTDSESEESGDSEEDSQDSAVDDGAQESDEETSEEAGEEKGSLTVLWILLALVVVGGVGFFVFKRKPKSEDLDDGFKAKADWAKHTPSKEKKKKVKTSRKAQRQKRKRRARKIKRR